MLQEISTKRLTWAERVAAFFSYFPLFLPFSGITLLILNRKNPVVRFVAMQSIIMWPFYIVVNFLLGAIPVFGLLLSTIVQLALIILSIIVLFGVNPRIPWIFKGADNVLAGLSDVRATFFHRFLAWYINMFLTVSAALVLSIVAWIVLSVLGSSQEVVVNVLTVTALLSIAIVWTFNIVLMIRTGSDMGKRFLHLRVVDLSSEPIGVGTVILRETVGKLLSQIGDIGYMWVLIDKERQAWHDKLAKTIVIYEGR